MRKEPALSTYISLCVSVLFFALVWDSRAYSKTPHPYGEDELSTLYEEASQWIVAQAKIKKGFCLVLGCGEGRLAMEIAKRTDFRIIGLDQDQQKIHAARHLLDKAGLYGARVTVHHGTPDGLKFPHFFANLIVSEKTLVSGKLPDTPKAIHAMLRPCNGTLLIGQTEGFAKKSALNRLRLEKWLEAGNEYLILLDFKNNRGADRYTTLRIYLERYLRGKAWIRDLTIIDSKQTPFAQLCDILTGSVAAAYNGTRPDSAKEGLTRHIAARAGLSCLKTSTALSAGKFNIFKMDLGS